MNHEQVGFTKGCKVGSMSASQWMWYATLTMNRNPMIISTGAEKDFGQAFLSKTNGYQHPFMIKILNKVGIVESFSKQLYMTSPQPILC